MTVLTESARRLRTPRFATHLALVGVAAVALCAILGPLLWSVSPTSSQGLPFLGPSSEHLLGTDVLGRDVLSRVLHGGRTTLLIALCATVISTAAGLAIGTAAGLAPARLGEILVRGTDVIAVVPALLVLLVLAAGFPGQNLAVVVGVALVSVPFATRVVRGATTAVADTGYVEVARARGDHQVSVIRRDILPNITGPVFADTGTRFVAAIQLTAAAGFLGLGRGAPDPNWGAMVSENLPGIALTVSPVLAPTILLVMLSVSVNLLADRIQIGMKR
ncbi:ABC transporter permease (plasmid) [Rhodococcus globerulus]|uniref:ABC transporter permease n=1 Tax=Rhodococcus globerulus TaxID=33008 RepID=UPI0039EAA6FB